MDRLFDLRVTLASAAMAASWSALVWWLFKADARVGRMETSPVERRYRESSSKSAMSDGQATSVALDCDATGWVTHGTA